MEKQLELLVDEHLIEHMQDVDLRLGKPIPREIVIVHDQPWEGNTCGYHTIFQDGDLYRMYYRGSHHDTEQKKAGHRELTCYAESTDGIHWEKPDLGLVEFEGSKHNNIILDGIGTHCFTPFRDPNPESDPDAQYKGFGRGAGDAANQLFAFKSSDGIHWTLMSEKPAITQGAFDSQNLGFWDSVRQEYRAYFRDFGDGVRGIKTCVSDDFLVWTHPVWLQYPDAPTEHLYTNQIMPYYRAPHIFIGFPTRFIPHRDSLTEGLFMSSRDGQTFRRWGEAIIRPGQNQDRWHNRSNYIWWGLVETDSDLPGGGKELSLYSNERYYMGSGVRIRRYTYRIDGFVSVRAGLTGGEFVTKPLEVEGDTLVLNTSTSAAGSVRVEVQDAEGNPLPGLALSDCPEVYGDEIERVVKWQTDAGLDTLVGKQVRLRFVMSDADVYAFGFR